MSSSAMHVATTGLNAQQIKMQVIANNLANVNTNGFKRDRANFETLLYQVLRSGGAQTGDGTMLTSSATQGNLVATENSMDLAIDGQGFFQVLLPDGRMGYTRNGSFSRDAEGTLTTASGYVVQPEIQIPEGATEINVGANGVVSVLVGGQAEPQEVGQLTLVDFINPRGLQPIGESFAVETPASGGPIEGNPFEGGFGKVTQGFLEGSNVNVVQQLVDMIETQRAYEVSSKSITAVDEMMRYVSNNL